MFVGYKNIELKIKTDYSEEELKELVVKKAGVKNFSFQIEKKSLDARKRGHAFWLMKVGVFSSELIGEVFDEKKLEVHYKKRNKKVIVIGSGPAGFFAAYLLQKSGFAVTIVERGAEVDDRAKGIASFETTGVFNPVCNYAFGEGGAGTFSDGKLTARSKRISLEKNFILSTYIEAGAPEEIKYLSHPHLGSDNLKIMIKNLRQLFLQQGGQILFKTLCEDIRVKNEKVKSVVCSNKEINADYFVFASGHSAYETYKMLMKRGVNFRNKNFAIGSRVEHRQEIINKAQWGQENLPGVKAAEYRLSANIEGELPVYTFCMCPGGIIVPAAAYDKSNIVNGMSLYERNGVFANAACVAGASIEKILKKEVSPHDSLLWLEEMEHNFFKHVNGFNAPFCMIRDFIKQQETASNVKTSYPLGLKSAALWELFPKEVSSALRAGLKEFCRKIKGFEVGTIMGLESKTSAPIQVLRNAEGRCEGFDNLYMVGEGSGCAGGIISSAADGVRAALRIIECG